MDKNHLTIAVTLRLCFGARVNLYIVPSPKEVVGLVSSPDPTLKLPRPHPLEGGIWGRDYYVHTCSLAPCSPTQKIKEGDPGVRLTHMSAGISSLSPQAKVAFSLGTTLNIFSHSREGLAHGLVSMHMIRVCHPNLLDYNTSDVVSSLDPAPLGTSDGA